MKNVLIIGGAGLLGQNFVKNLKKDGYNPVVADYDIKKAKDFCQLNNLDAPIRLDINSEESLNESISYVKDNYESLYAVINTSYPRNSSYGLKLEDVTYDSFCENINLNIGGYFITMKKFFLYFKEIGRGNFINLGSVYGVIAPKFEVYNNTSMTMPIEYAAIKSSLIHLTKYFAKYSRGTHIQFNTVSPGGILDNQDQTFLEEYKKKCLNKGMLDPQDIYGSIRLLLSEDGRFINGQNLIIDDGFTL